MNGRAASTGWLSSNHLDNIHIVSGQAHLAADLAKELDVEAGAVINPVLCKIGNIAFGQEETVVLVLMAGDMACDAAQVSRAMNRSGQPVSRLSDEEISHLTEPEGLDGLFPLQLATDLPTILDASLKRFECLYSHAGNRKCLMETSYADLKDMTGGVISYALAQPGWFDRP